MQIPLVIVRDTNKTALVKVTKYKKVKVLLYTSRKEISAGTGAQRLNQKM